MAYESILTCAIFAKSVYQNADRVGWRHAVMPVSAPDRGFYGEALTNDKDSVIIAVRGTAEMQDAIDDLNMMPHISGNKADHAMRKLVIEYCRGTPAYDVVQGINDAGFIAGGIFKAKENSNMKDWGNRVPETQAKFACVLAQRAYQYCKEKKFKLLCFTGHSLGGALSQYLSEQTGNGGATGIPEKIPAVAFNSPSMGTIDGMRKGQGGGILCINARLDPLSLATKLAGNVSHAKGDSYYIHVETKTPEPPPKVSEDLFKREDFLKWLGKAADCYHGMGNLCEALRRSYPGAQSLSSFFPRR